MVLLCGLSVSLFTLLEPKTHISKPKIQNACLVNYCHHALSKNSFSKFEGLLCFHIGPWSYFAKNANKFEMLLLVIFSIIPKLPLFLFEIPILPRSLLKKKKKKIPLCRRRISLHFMLPPRQLQEAQKKNRSVQVVAVLLSFPFLQLLTNKIDCKILNQMCNVKFQHNNP